MSIDKDVEKRFEEIDEDLKDHNNRLKVLEIEFAKTNTTLEYLKQSNDDIKDSLKRVENNNLQNQNIILNSLNQLVVNKEKNKSQEKISKFDNLTKISVQIIITGGLLIGGILSGKFLF